MPELTTGFTQDSELWQVLQHPAGADLVDRYLPGLAATTELHTLHTFPIRLIAATDPTLGDDDAVRREFLSELTRLDPDARFEFPAVDQRVSPDYEDENVVVGSAPAEATAEVPLYGRFELRIEGPTHGNPFVDVDLAAALTLPDGSVRNVTGFYDGDGVYRVRFLPEQSGAHSFVTASNARSIDGISGAFVVGSPSHGRHGPVRVADTFHFAHADGTRHRPIGTTAYVWNHQGEELERATLGTLADAPFNKLRMCVFPKSYLFNENEPTIFPFERDEDGAFDPRRPDPRFWRRLEDQIDALAALGIQADLILFHGYDRWGFATMSPADDDRYIAYAVSRLAAFENVWWSLANEYDLLFTKYEHDWERLAQIVQDHDPVGHLLSIHNCRDFYDHARPWITHASIQRRDVYRTAENTDEWRAQWGKPVIIDECAYEGDIDQGWGDITGEEMTRRFWEGAVRGGYVGHGETYVDEHDVLWWSKGGVLKGSSPSRIGFLREILEEGPNALEPLQLEWDVPRAGVEDQYYLYYFGATQPTYRRFIFDPEVSYTVDIIDTWAMTIERLPGVHSGRFRIDLPGTPYLAVRLQAVESSSPEQP